MPNNNPDSKEMIEDSLSRDGYLNLIWAIIFGFTLFSQIPDFWTIVRGSMIIGCGLYIYRREEAIKKN